MPSAKARALDAGDPLARHRKEFLLPEGKVYLDGNSLGALPRQVPGVLDAVTREQWGDDLITSWNSHGWIDLPSRVGEKIAPLVGAAPGQVICCDSISVNLHKLLCCALALRPGRQRVLAPRDSFPTDLYMAQGLKHLPGELEVEVVLVPQEALAGSVDADTAAVLFSHVNFRSGAVLPAEAITRAAHDAGALVILDLAHSAGVLPVALDDWQIDFAVGCGYKFLNGGPGAPAFLYAAGDLQAACSNPLSGWMGHARPFDFSRQYEASPGIRRFLCGTPPVLSMAVLDAALDSFEGVNTELLREKSIALGDFYIELVEGEPRTRDLVLASPREAELRGSQVAFAHPRAYGICQALLQRDVIMDFREPDILRAGFSPLYNSFDDILQAVSRLAEVLEAEEHLAPEHQVRKTVT
jgi:kynureninase